MNFRKSKILGYGQTYKFGANDWFEFNPVVDQRNYFNLLTASKSTVPIRSLGSSDFLQTCLKEFRKGK